MYAGVMQYAGRAHCAQDAECTMRGLDEDILAQRLLRADERVAELLRQHDARVQAMIDELIRSRQMGDFNEA